MKKKLTKEFRMKFILKRLLFIHIQKRNYGFSRVALSLSLSSVVDENKGFSRVALSLWVF
jgi:hypothetical protein